MGKYPFAPTLSSDKQRERERESLLVSHPSTLFLCSFSWPDHHKGIHTGDYSNQTSSLTRCEFTYFLFPFKLITLLCLSGTTVMPIFPLNSQCGCEVILNSGSQISENLPILSGLNPFTRVGKVSCVVLNAI